MAALSPIGRMMTKRIWQRNPFSDVTGPDDTIFIANLDEARVRALPRAEMNVGLIHDAREARPPCATVIVPWLTTVARGSVDGELRRPALCRRRCGRGRRTGRSTWPLLAPTSPVFNSPTSFPAQSGGWDTPGFCGPPGVWPFLTLAYHPRGLDERRWCDIYRYQLRNSIGYV